MNHDYDSHWTRREQWMRRRSQQFDRLRTRIRRAPDGKVLGVFKGIADSMGWCLRWTRIGGVLILLSLSSFFGVEGFKASVLACGFFYMLAALLMGPPRNAPDDFGSSEPTASPPRMTRAEQRYAARYGKPERVDFDALDRQMEKLNRRIRRMESVVTDPQFEWERRLAE